MEQVFCIFSIRFFFAIFSDRLQVCFDFLKVLFALTCVRFDAEKDDNDFKNYSPKK